MREREKKRTKEILKKPVWSGWLQLTGAGPNRNLENYFPLFPEVLRARKKRRRRRRRRKKKRKKNTHTNKINAEHKVVAYPFPKTLS